MVSANNLISFDSNGVQTGCTVTHTPGSTAINLNKPGFYFVTFNGTASATAAATDPIIVALQKNGAEIDGATASALSSAVDTPVNLSFSTIVRVLPSCPYIDNNVTLTLINSGILADYSEANVVVTKLC